MNASGEALKFFAYLLSLSDGKLETYTLASYHVEKAISFIKNYYNDGELNVTNLAKVVGLTRNHFCNVFVQITGVSPVKYLMNYRLEQAKKLLEMGASVTQTAFDTGFNSSANFSVQFKKKVGVTPITYRKKGESKSKT